MRVLSLFIKQPVITTCAPANKKHLYEYSTSTVQAVPIYQVERVFDTSALFSTARIAAGQSSSRVISAPLTCTSTPSSLPFVASALSAFSSQFSQ